MVTLNLTDKEAAALKGVLGRCNGSVLYKAYSQLPESREHQALYAALGNIDIRPHEHLLEPPPKVLSTITANGVTVTLWSDADKTSLVLGERPIDWVNDPQGGAAAVRYINDRKSRPL